MFIDMFDKTAAIETLIGRVLAVTIGDALQAEGINYYWRTLLRGGLYFWDAGTSWRHNDGYQ